jgi:hypothetical protein
MTDGDRRPVAQAVTSSTAEIDALTPTLSRWEREKNFFT